MGQSKRKTLLRHARQRVLERFGIDFTTEKLSRMVAAINGGKFPLLFKQSNRVAVYKAKIEGKSPTVLYDKVRKCIITFLPEEK